MARSGELTVNITGAYHELSEVLGLLADDQEPLFDFERVLRGLIAPEPVEGEDPPEGPQVGDSISVYGLTLDANDE